MIIINTNIIMEKKDIQEKLTFIFREVFEDDTLVLQDSLSANDVDGWESITHMMMVTQVEKEFGVKFKLVQLGSLESVGDIINAIGTNLK